jgi:hypothetical protein
MAFEMTGPQSSTRLAIELLTTWRQRGQDPETALLHIARASGLNDLSISDELRAQYTHTVAGLLGLAELLALEVGALKAAEELGVERKGLSPDQMEAKAAEYLQNLALGMPDDPRPENE